MVDVRALVQARNYHPGRLRPVRLVVVHDMEAPERTATAENIASWFAGPNAPEASAHDCIDSDSVVPCVRDDDTAWAAPGANADGIQLELAGYAAQTIDEWLDPYGKLLLENAAFRTAQRCKKYSIPVRWLSAAQVRDGATKGICGHADVTAAFPELGSGHVDPGAGFPKSYFLGRVRAALGLVTDPDPRTHEPTPLLVDGILASLTVRRLQAYLNAQGARPLLVVDGDAGEATWKAVDVWLGVDPPNGVLGRDTVRALERRLGTPTPDGVLGRDTVRALQRFLNAAGQEPVKK